MHISRCVAAVVIPIVSLSQNVCAADQIVGARTALDEYITKPDSAYSWKVAKTVRNSPNTIYVVDLKSQHWRTQEDVNRTLWQHWLMVIKPERVEHETALLFIGGGRNGKPAPDRVRGDLVAIAQQTKSVVAELGMVPNQPLVFHGDGKERVEDDLIAYSWVQYLRTGDATWLPRFPMAKSAVRAMDAITELLAGEQGGNVTVNRFVVAGGSKRGWTTWITAAVDKRVVAAIPIVIDVLNVRKSMIHHYSAYGFWAPAIGDYVRHKIPEWMDTPEYAALLKLVDPYSYRDRLTMPKYMVNATGDQFFLPDSSQFYFDDLKGPKYLRYVPNADHSLKESDAMASIEAFYHAILRSTPLPKFSWRIEADQSIRVLVQDRPEHVHLWQATNPKARDFRLETLGKVWQKSKLTPNSAGEYVAIVEPPPTGWTAFLVELIYPSGERYPFKFTTQVHVVPNRLPHSIEEWRKTRLLPSPR
jgi:PhoPQ-activated pathogenicity-related protein